MEPIFSELSEDDAACSMPTKNVATTKVNKFAPPPDISNQDEVKGPPSDQGVETSLLKDMLGVARPAKSLNASDDGNDDIRSKSNLTTSQGKPQGKSFAVYLQPRALIVNRWLRVQTNEKIIYQ